MTMTPGSSPRPPSAPSKSAEALRLRSLGLSNKQVAAVLDVPVPSARRLISEAKRVGHEGHALEILEKAMPGFGAAYSQRAHKKPTHVFIPDPQCAPDTPLEHLRWAGQYIKEHGADVIVNAGDHWDLPSLSSYEGKGSKYFEGKRYLSDVAAGNKGLELFEEGLGGFAPQRKVILRGNHEFRGDRAVNEDPKLEGLIGEHLFNDVALGWTPVPFLHPIEIDQLWYSHYWVQPNTGRAYSGTVENMIKNIGFSFVAGHQQGLRYARRELSNGKVQVGLVAGSFYQVPQSYRGPQATNEWCGIIVMHEVGGGDYNLMQISMDYLRRKFS